jgi:hypothetical protein
MARALRAAGADVVKEVFNHAKPEPAAGMIFIIIFVAGLGLAYDRDARDGVSPGLCLCAHAQAAGGQAPAD